MGKTGDLVLIVHGYDYKKREEIYNSSTKEAIWFSSPSPAWVQWGDDYNPRSTLSNRREYQVEQKHFTELWGATKNLGRLTEPEGDEFILPDTEEARQAKANFDRIYDQHFKRK